jgi:uncharacterized membrane protein YesL
MNEKRGYLVGIQTLFDPDNVVWSFLLKVYSLLLAGLLWFLCSLPIITLGPATIALYSYCFAVLDDRESYLFKSFFSTYAKSLKQGIAVTILLLLIGAFLFIDAWFFLNTMPMLFFVVAGLGILVLFPALHLFALMSMQKSSIKDFLKLALYLSIKHPAVTITVLLVVTVWFLSMYALPASLLFSAGPACMLAAMFLRSFYKHIGVYTINNYNIESKSVL